MRQAVTSTLTRRRYLYHLIAYYLEGWKRPAYMWVFLLSQMKRLTLLDYGCGIGCDGVMFLEAGLRVSFADVASASLQYLRWRLRHRCYFDAPVYVLPDTLLPRHDVVWCMDTLEHLPPEAQAPLIDQLATLGDMVIVNLVDDRDADSVVHHPVYIEVLTQHIASQWPVAYTDWYVRTDGGKTRFLCFGTLLPEMLVRYINMTISINEDAPHA